MRGKNALFPKNLMKISSKISFRGKNFPLNVKISQEPGYWVPIFQACTCTITARSHWCHWQCEILLRTSQHWLQMMLLVYSTRLAYRNNTSLASISSSKDTILYVNTSLLLSLPTQTQHVISWIMLCPLIYRRVYHYESCKDWFYWLFPSPDQ